MTSMKVVGEFGWLKTLLPKLYWPASRKSQLWIGPGDDAGVVGIKTGKLLVATTDAMVEGVHFERKWFPWKDLGHKVLAINLSDLAAMGAVRPLAALVTASIPGDTPVDNVNKFYQGMNNCAQRWKIGFLGGDTVGSKKGWVVSVTVFGEAKKQELITRSGAKAGDYLLTTGPLGLASAGLEVLQSNSSKRAGVKTLLDAFLRVQPRLKEGDVLGRGKLATSLMDCSDGLEASVRHLSEASSVGVEIDLTRLPITKELSQWAHSHGRHPWDYALKGGEDYELIFTAKPGRAKSVLRQIPHAFVIGKILPKGKGCWAVLPGRRFPLKSYGFSHFAA